MLPVKEQEKFIEVCTVRHNLPGALDGPIVVMVPLDNIAAIYPSTRADEIMSKVGQIHERTIILLKSGQWMGVEQFVDDFLMDLPTIWSEYWESPEELEAKREQASPAPVEQK
jgi:hypothetical protein